MVGLLLPLSARAYPKILPEPNRTAGFFLRVRVRGKNNFPNLNLKVCTGLRSPCFGKCDPKSSLISDCLLSESVPSNLSLNMSQSHGKIQGEVPAKGTSESVLHTCGYDRDNY